MARLEPRSAQRLERLETGGLELVPRVPARHLVRFGDDEARPEPESRVLHHAVEAPFRGQLVARLVIVVLIVLLDALDAPAFRPPDEVGAGAKIERRHADLREIELIRSIVVALVGELVGLHHPALQLADLSRDVVERRLAEADEGDVARLAPDVAAVV